MEYGVYVAKANKKVKRKVFKEKEWRLRPKTLEIHGGGEISDVELRPSVHRVTAFSMGSFDRARRLFAGEEAGFIYTRINNPTVDRLERRLASLEGAEAALATSSGMSAIQLLSLYLANSGGHVVSSNRLYGGVFHLFRDMLPKLGIPVTFVETTTTFILGKKPIGPTLSFFMSKTPPTPLLMFLT